MSAITVAPAASKRGSVDRHPRLRAIPDEPLADVREISTAPSVQRRRRVLCAEDPAMRRRPARASATMSPAVRTSRRSGASLVARAALTVLAVGAGVGVGVGAGLLAQPDAYSGPTVEHSVTAGESVWGLASAVGSDRPLEQVVVDIEQLNGIQGGLTVGQEVMLPTE